MKKLIEESKQERQPNKNSDDGEQKTFKEDGRPASVGPEKGP